jgi:hypothetical protein
MPEGEISLVQPGYNDGEGDHTGTVPLGGHLMPFYVCHRGDSDHVAMQQPGAFVLRDSQGRDWICCEGKPSSENKLISELETTQRSADAQGLSDQGFQVVWLTCAKEELPQLLGEEAEPPEDPTTRILDAL